MNEEQLMVTIPICRYEHLLDIETRAIVVIERIINDNYIRTEDVLRILGTDEAIQEANRMKEEDERYKKEINEKLDSEEEKRREKEANEKYGCSVEMERR